MLNEQLKDLVIKALENVKARDISLLDVSGLCDFTDFMIICSGTSTRHVKSLANNVVEEAKNHGIRPLGVEGETSAEWILVDLGDVVVHIMDPQVRAFYQLEQLWGMQPE